MASSGALLMVYLVVVGSVVVLCVGGNFYEDVDITWGDGRGKIINQNLISLSLDKYSGSGFQSKNQYLFGKINMNIKLIHGNSAGTVTAFYLKSEGRSWDEIDFEFLGNLSGEPYIAQTNIYTQGNGNREQQFYLWFNPTADFHTYTILWNPKTIIFYVDGTPIREFKNKMASGSGVLFPMKQPMRMYSSLWDADEWATKGGHWKTDWSAAPFTSLYSNFTADGCIWPPSAGAWSCGGSSQRRRWYSELLSPTQYEKLKWVQKNYMVYNYCEDNARFPHGLPLDCAL